MLNNTISALYCKYLLRHIVGTNHTIICVHIIVSIYLYLHRYMHISEGLHEIEYLYGLSSKTWHGIWRDWDQERIAHSGPTPTICPSVVCTWVNALSLSRLGHSEDTSAAALLCIIFTGRLAIGSSYRVYVWLNSMYHHIYSTLDK